jgi:WD40 repeat protein
MTAPQDIRIFISYARKDSMELAQRIQGDLQQAGFDAWLDTKRFKGGANWTEEIEQEIDARQLTLALLTPGSYQSEICRAEQLRTLRRGKRLIPLLAAKDADRPLHLEARQYRDFSDSRHYKERLQELVADILGDVTATLPESFRKTRINYVTAPPRVANYLERPEALRALRNILFAEDQRQPIALTAIAGMGGIGKTVLAQALTKDEVVQQAFPDGIVWITMGREAQADFTKRMREVAKALGDDLEGYEDSLACQNQYKTTIASKAALIVVDDVWSKADIEPLLAESPRSRFLFTTRDSAIGRFVGATEHSAKLLSIAQSRELLASWAGLKVGELPKEADEIIDECGQLPLALSQIGAMLRGADSQFWTDTLELLRKVDLSAIQEQLPPGQESFFRAVEVSFQSLEPKMRDRYKTLAVLLEDMSAPLPILETLWKVDGREARRTSRLFVDRSLAQREGDDSAIRLHDLQLDYVQAQYEDKEALNLIHWATRLSSNVIDRGPAQYASQLVGRLLPLQDMPSISRFTTDLTVGAPKPWLRPMHPALHPPGTRLVRTLEGHSGYVRGVGLRGDGKLAVSVSNDETLTVWDVESGRVLRTLEGHTGPLNGVALSVDGKRAVSASNDKTLRVWDVESGRVLRVLEGHTGAVNGAALSKDGKYAVSASEDKTLKVWEVESARVLQTLRGHSGEVNGVAFSGDAKRAISASRDKTLKVWDVESGRLLRTLVGHFFDVRGVAMSADGKRAISASRDKTLKVWDVENGCLLRTLEGHTGWLNGVALSENGKRAVSASNDNTLKVWDVESGSALHTLEGHSFWVNGVALSKDGKRAISASDDKTLKVWDVGSSRVAIVLEGHTGWVNGIALSGDGKCAISASNDMTLKVWDVESCRVLHTLKGHSGRVSGVALSGDGKCAISASWDDTLKVWDVENSRVLRTLTGHSSFVNGVALSTDGKRAISASNDNTLKVWDVESGCLLRTLEGHTGWVNGVALSENGKWAVSTSHDKTLKVWDMKDGRAPHTLEGHTDTVYGVALTRDGSRAISASFDKTLKVWDLQSGRMLYTLEGHASGVFGVALSGDDKRAVSASDDKTVKVWDVESGNQLVTFTCDGMACCCAFLNYREIIAGDFNGQVHFLRFEETKRKD